MAQIFETKHFTVESHPKPFVSREEGGHIRIFPKRKVTDRTKLTRGEAIELVLLTMIVGEAMETAMISRGVPVIKVNYQDMGNWPYKRNEKPLLHIHVFGRAKNAKHQVFPEAVQLPDRSTGFYDKFEPLDNDDIKEIKKQIAMVSRGKNYSF